MAAAQQAVISFSAGAPSRVCPTDPLRSVPSAKMFDSQFEGCYAAIRAQPYRRPAVSCSCCTRTPDVRTRSPSCGGLGPPAQDHWFSVGASQSLWLTTRCPKSLAPSQTWIITPLSAVVPANLRFTRPAGKASFHSRPVDAGTPLAYSAAADAIRSGKWCLLRGVD